MTNHEELKGMLGFCIRQQATARLEVGEMEARYQRDMEKMKRRLRQTDETIETVKAALDEA